MYESLTAEQKLVVDTVMAGLGRFFDGSAASDTIGSNCLYVDGPGGSGKSYVYRCLFHLIRAKGFSVLMMASTGAAATLLPTGCTVHHAAMLPVPLRSDSKADPRGGKLKRFVGAHVMFIDEAPMLLRFAVEAIDERLRELRPQKKHLPFAGTTMVLGGDFR